MVGQIRNIKVCGGVVGQIGKIKACGGVIRQIGGNQGMFHIKDLSDKTNIYMVIWLTVAGLVCDWLIISGLMCDSMIVSGPARDWLRGFR